METSKPARTSKPAKQFTSVARAPRAEGQRPRFTSVAGALRAEGPRITTIAALLATALLAAAAAAAEPPLLPVAEKTLANGLRVLVHEDHDIPNAALYVAWRVGSRNERPGITGLAHFFEHMMFTGGARFGKSFDPTMEGAGGSNNAYTTRDVTVYTDWFPAAKLELILEMEADRMRGMVFDPKVVESERGVVASERRSSMDNPGSVLREQLWAAAYTAHPYQWPVLGWMVDIENWKPADLAEFFRRHYAPENATVTVAGAVDAAAVFRLVEKHMGAIPRGPGRRPVHTAEPPQRGERRVTVRIPGAGLPQVPQAWHIEATAHPDFAVYEVLERLLVAGESSRLHRDLVEESGVALSVGGGWMGHQFQPSLFSVEVKVREGKTSLEAEARVGAALAKLAAHEPAARELTRVKNALRADFVRRLKTIDGKASLIAETDTFFGGYDKTGARLAAIQAVTPADVRRVAAAVFTRDNRTTATLEVE